SAFIVVHPTSRTFSTCATDEAIRFRLRVMSCFSFSRRGLSDLCASAVNISLKTLTAETQRTQRRRREFQIRTLPSLRMSLRHATTYHYHSLVQRKLKF